MQSEESGAFLSPVWLPTFTLTFNLAQFAFKSCTSNNFIYLLASRRFTAVSYNSEGGDKKYVLKKKGNWQALFPPSTDGTREFYALNSTDLRPYQNRICRITH